MKVVFLTTAGGSTWTVPADVTSATIELLGAGGDAIQGTPGVAQKCAGDGGAGGLYAKYIDVVLTPGAEISFQVGAHGGVQGGGGATPGTADTWFDNPFSYYAEGGKTGANALGGSHYSGSPIIHNKGGDSNTTADYTGSTGGGGAGGPNGPGGTSGIPELFPFNSGGTGGGGANGGGNSPNGVSNPGTPGGANRLGAGAGAGAPSAATAGAPGSVGGGGGGGFGGGTGNFSAGGAGSQDDLWTDGTTTYGPGSGGGGAGYGAGDPADGGNAGGRGAGGGGPTGGGAIGLGTDGLIIITYGPAIPSGRACMVWSRIGNPQLAA